MHPFEGSVCFELCKLFARGEGCLRMVSFTLNPKGHDDSDDTLIKSLSLKPVEYIKEQFKNKRCPIHIIGRSSNEYILIFYTYIEHVSSVLKLHCNFKLEKELYFQLTSIV
jgi:hypothetical protein